MKTGLDLPSLLSGFSVAETTSFSFSHQPLFLISVLLVRTFGVV
jgi:hypothetical protein